MATYVTREKYEQMRKDLEELKKLKQELSAEIGEAMAQGDLKENAEYQYAKAKQNETLIRINELEMKIKTATITDDMQVDQSHVRIGATITIENPETKAKTVYTLVGTEEADPANGTISVESPVAKGALGKQAGESFEVQLPSGTKVFNLLKLQYK